MEPNNKIAILTSKQWNTYLEDRRNTAVVEK